MFMRSLLLLGAVSLVGCGVSAGGTDQPDAEAASSTATAIVAVERTVGPGDLTRDDVVARFVRVRQGAVDVDALRLAGAALDLPALGACTSPEVAPSTAAARNVELVDVGGVSLEGVATKTTLMPRAMPDPSGAVSGLFYSARAEGAFTPGARVQLRATGGDLAEGFQASVASPRDLGDVRVASTSSGLELVWDTADDPRDVVYVDVSSASALVTRCAVADAGRFVVPASALAGLDDGLVAVHRVHRESFRARGVEPGEVRFDLARVVAWKR
jgi:hypothetical protein